MKKQFHSASITNSEQQVDNLTKQLTAASKVGHLVSAPLKSIKSAFTFPFCNFLCRFLFYVQHFVYFYILHETFFNFSSNRPSRVPGRSKVLGCITLAYIEICFESWRYFVIFFNFLPPDANRSNKYRRVFKLNSSIRRTFAEFVWKLRLFRA